MQPLTCSRCGASIRWDGVSRTVACDYCGAEFLMHPRARDGFGTDGVGRDEVAIIPIREGRHAGRAYARSFIPKGWTASAANPELTCSLYSPITMRVRYVDDKGRATISYTGCVCCEHIDDVPANAQLQWRVHMPDCKCLASYRDAAAMCDMTVGSAAGAACQLLRDETNGDDLVKAHVDKIRAAVEGSNQVSDWGYSYCRRTYRITLGDGSRRLRVIEALVDYVYIPPSQAELAMYQQAQALLARTNPFGSFGAFFGARQQSVPAPKGRLAWETLFMWDVDAAEDCLDEAMQACKLIRASYEESPEFRRTSAQMSDELALAQMRQAEATNAALSQMMRDNAAHWDRMNAITRDANDYTTGVMRDMISSNAASHQRVANLQSEMIRDVNTYHAQGGVVEASTSWDHVYQSTEDRDWFVATEGFGLRPGVDYEELPRTHGDY